MADKMTDMTDRELDALFEAARTEAPLPSGDVMARILADAEAEQARAQIVVAPTTPARAVPRWRQLVSALGGWPAVAGLATATVAGIWIGANPPVTIESTALSMLGGNGGYAMVDLMPGAEFDLGEGAL